MERTYYTINERAAKTANDMMSFNDYKEGSKTAEYRGYVDKAYDLADKIVQARPNQEERVYSMAARYSKRMAEYMNRDIHIGCMCPSVLISGAGHFPVRKKEKQNQAWEKNHEFYKETQKIYEKMESILHGKEVIKSGDEDAIERLEEKLQALKETQETMKAANKAIRLKNTEKGDEELRNMGYSDEQIKQLREPDFAGRVGYPGYLLQNNNANIHRVEGRLKSLKAAKEKGTQETENQFCKVVENTELMRLQLIFDGKPEEEIRSLLKANGFRWSPSQGAWQRQLTSNAKYAASQVMKKLNELLPESSDGQQAGELTKPKAEVTLTVAECSEFHNLGEYHEGITSVDEALTIFKKIPPERMNGIPSIGIQVSDVQMDIFSGNIIDLELLDHVPELRENKEAIKVLKELMTRLPEAEVIGKLPGEEREVQSVESKTELTEFTQETFDLIKQYKELKELDFSNIYFKNIKFDTEIEKCNFTNSKFYNCEFTENIQECNFTNCDMDVEFRLGNVENCNFTNARIEGSAYQEKFLANDFTEAKVQRFRMFGQSEFSKNELQGTAFDGAFFGEYVAVAENHFLDSVKVELSDLPDSLQEYSQQQMKVLNGEKTAYGEKLTSLSNTMAEQRANRYLNEFAEMHKENIANANLEGMKKTVVINAFAGAGAGKTTACHMIAAELKKRGYVAEYVSEYAKDLVWDKKYEMLDGKERNQFEILKEQLHRMDNKIGKVDFIVTDAPVLLNQIYNQELTDYYKEMLISINSDYSNFNFFINRNPEEFQQEGRLQNLTESLEKDREIKEMLSEYKLEYQEYTHETLENIVDKIVGGQENMEGMQKNKKCYEIDNTWKAGDVVGEDFYKFLCETYAAREMTENYLQLADEVREENSTTGEFNGENTIRPLNPDTQKPEPVYRTFMEKNGEYIYVGHCFAGDKIEYGEKFGQWKREKLHQKGKNGKTQEDVSETERKVKITNHEFDREGYLHFQAEVDGYGLEGLYRVCDPANGSSFTLVSIDYGVLHEEIKEEWNMIEKELRDYTKEHFEAYVKTEPDISGMRKAEMLMELKEMDKSVFLPTERNLIMDYANKIDDIDKTITLINEIAEPKDDGIVRRAADEIEQYDQRITKEIKTMEGLDKFVKESGKERITDYLQVGDAVSEDMINHFMNIMPPRSMAYGYLQVGEPYSDALNPQTGKMEATYMTFAVDSETGNYTYRGNCFAGESAEPPKEQEKTLEKAEQFAEESVESNYPPRDMSPTWEHIEEQWNYLEEHAAEYTPEAYEEAKMEIEAQEMFLEEQEQVFIESIEDVKVSEKIEEKPIGTVEVKGEVVEFSSENEGLEKYIDASFKLSVSELESLKSFENEQWKITFNEPEKHLLLQYKVEKYFKEAANDEEYTLEDFCKDHEGKIKMRDVVKETGERLTEFGDSALKIKGESENNKIEVERNTEPPSPGITKQEVHDILEILKGAASRHEELRELQEISLYISSMEQQLKEVSQQLDFVKDKLTSIQNKNPEVDKLINDTEILKKHTFSLQEKLQEIKRDFTEMIKNVSESIKQTGQTGLNKLMEHFKIEEKLENFQSGLSKLTADVTEKQIKMERIGYEIGQAGAHLQNVDRVVNGKVTLEPSQNAGIALGNNLASPLKKIKEALNSLNEKTGKVLGKVKKLKTQAAENQKKKGGKKRGKIKTEESEKGKT